jgi:hypothetical protein
MQKLISWISSIWILISVLVTFSSLNGFASVPMLRVKTGFSNLIVNAGDRLKNEPLTPMVTFQPSLHMEVPQFSSRIGVHYLQEMGGAYGLTPLSGIGISGYYYFYGISTSYSVGGDGTVIQKSRPGPVLFGSVTPINFNLNRMGDPVSANNFFFSTFMYDVSAGLGYDYPFNRNMVFGIEYVLRNGSGADAKKQTVSYRGSTIFLSFGTSYF